MEKNYYNDTSENSARNLQIDEMMISNMLKALENPVITKMMSEEDLAVMCQVIKNHVVSNANAILEAQKEIAKSKSMDLDSLHDLTEEEEAFWFDIYSNNGNKRNR